MPSPKIKRKKVKRKAKTGEPAVEIKATKGTKTRPSSYDIKVGSTQNKHKVRVSVVGQSWGVKDVGYPDYRYAMGNAVFTFYLPNTRPTMIRKYVNMAIKEIHKNLSIGPKFTLYTPTPEAEESQPLKDFLFEAINERLKRKKPRRK